MNVRTLAELVRTNEALDKEYAEAEATFKFQYKNLIAAREKAKKDIEAARAVLEIEATEKWLQEGVKPEPPLGLQIRRTPTLYNTEALYDWAWNNMPELLRLDEKATKAYVEHEGVRILSPDGEVLAGMQERPTLVAGAKTLITWLEELEWSENVAKEQEAGH